MAINLELPQKLAPVTEQAHLAAEHIFRPISRTYDKAEHTYPEELDELGKLAREAARKGRESDAADKSSAKKSDVVNG
ncbi:acyl-CoA dehydrogenase, partial [Mycobacterium tuberculosis]|nr:acyl-CoA dehydrogenase [Mycobacterium tuberculosis]